MQGMYRLGIYGLLYSIVVLGVQLLLPSAILILPHARYVQTGNIWIAVHHCTVVQSVQLLLPSAILILAHARYVQTVNMYRLGIYGLL